jgi:hypothetical protein
VFRYGIQKLEYELFWAGKNIPSVSQYPDIQYMAYRYVARLL